MPAKHYTTDYPRKYKRKWPRGVRIWRGAESNVCMWKKILAKALCWLIRRFPLIAFSFNEYVEKCILTLPEGYRFDPRQIRIKTAWKIRGLIVWKIVSSEWGGRKALDAKRILMLANTAEFTLNKAPIIYYKLKKKRIWYKAWKKKCVRGKKIYVKRPKEVRWSEMNDEWGALTYRGPMVLAPLQPPLPAQLGSPSGFLKSDPIVNKTL